MTIYEFNEEQFIRDLREEGREEERLNTERERERADSERRRAEKAEALLEKYKAQFGELQ